MSGAPTDALPTAADVAKGHGQPASEATEGPGSTVLLQVEELSVAFGQGGQLVRVVDRVSFQLARGETLCLVGESGCGKSVTALSLMRLLPERRSRIEARRIALDGVDLLPLSEREMCRVRGGRIGMVFQEPMSALNPVMTVGNQVIEAIRLHRPLRRSEASQRAVELLRRVGLPSPEAQLRAYPHQLSGGMRQRVVIAIAIAADPIALIADEPTTALDVTIQAQIVRLLVELQREAGMGMLLITHDLGLVAETADCVAVMYAGRIVEEAGVAELFRAPRHPYTQGLLDCIPALSTSKKRLPTIEGRVPPPTSWGGGCRFRERCPRASSRCRDEMPELEACDGDGLRAHRVACFHPLSDEV
ncbi:MAG: ABC transporter ATP-binding protein [Myxococcales bacterium]|nr:ABC transporter ATP-binding protein [Myxococcales bacterium]